MASKGICDRVAIVGMGCTKFGEHWNRSASDLLVDAVQEAYGSAGIEPDNVDAYWLGTTGSGISGLTLSEPLKIQYKPVTRLENMCATGSEAIRNAAYAVASGAYDLVMAVGVEKLKDSGFSGLTGSAPPGDGTESGMTAPANFSLLAPAYAEKYGVDLETMRDVLTKIAYKNHYNGARNEKAQFQREVPIEKINASPKVAGMLGIMDCSGVSDGSAAAVICRAEDAHKYNDNPIFIKALSFVAGPSEGAKRQDYDFTTFPEVVESARDAYVQAGIEDPREQISMAEVHDCFTPTELVLMEDLGFSPRGQAWKDTMDGRFDLDGDQPVNPDGGLKSFGHPIGASGLRMMYEMWLQLRGEAGERQIADPKVGLTHNLGGAPGRCVSFVSVVGL
ncbi:MAG: acetyl-CoA acetyltransferase [Holophagales bacterium]|nr:acetyl-CoA acetyltransferase [Holophagales bacterium]MYG30337.1 acetyl-CoA acetyltransferase [Holophagales bacterium]MYI80920.1 acetyl-CoA acetyltransferase [Holophagales bacterium]